MSTWNYSSIISSSCTHRYCLHGTITGLITIGSTLRCFLHGTITGIITSRSIHRYCLHGTITGVITSSPYFLFKQYYLHKWDQVSYVGVQLVVKFSLVRFYEIFLITAVLPQNRLGPRTYLDYNKNVKG